jgi:small subunit ribosomal protein S18
LAKIPLNRLKRFKRNCAFCESKTVPDYKDVEILKKYTSERGKILAAEKTGICSKHQRQISEAIKRARYLALMPFVKNR